MFRVEGVQDDTVKDRRKGSARVTGIVIGLKLFTLYLSDGRQIAVPFYCYPQLSAANFRQRANFEVCAGGRMLHWPEIDEDIEVQHIVKGMTPVKTKPACASAVAETRAEYHSKRRSGR